MEARSLFIEGFLKKENFEDEDDGLGGGPETAVQVPKLVYNQNDLRAPGAMAAPCTYQQQALVESCEVSGYLDDVIEYLSEVICGVGFNDAIAVAVRRIEAANVESGSASGAFKDQWYGAFSVCLVYFFNNNILAIRGLLSGCVRVMVPRGSSPGRCLTWADPYHLN
ncbi:hypothetical protein quinque_002410 [Culex quinquefasciatus]